MPAEKVFTSYAHEDSALASKIAKLLTDGSFSFWKDERIGPGARWDRVIQEQLDACDTVLVIVSRVSMRSENVLDEAYYALDHNKVVLPIVCEECELPLRLHRLNYFDARVSHTAEELTLWLRAAYNATTPMRRNSRSRPKLLKIILELVIPAAVFVLAAIPYFYFASLELHLRDVEAVAAMGMAFSALGNWARAKVRNASMPHIYP